MKGTALPRLSSRRAGSDAHADPPGEGTEPVILPGNAGVTAMKAALRLCLSLFFVICLATGAEGRPLQVAGLRCEYLENPNAVDAIQPRLSWVLAAGERGRRQTAYRILVASTVEQLRRDEPDLWDSGKVSSDRSTHVRYAGRPLTSRQQCWWKVRVWDRDGRPAAWSSPAFWSMGLLSADDWKAKWIGSGNPADARHKSAPMLRRVFTTEKKVRWATAHVSGLGLFELHLNGQKVSDHIMDPPLSEYDKTVYYVTFDVTPLVRRGGNAIGVILGNGRYFFDREKFLVPVRTYGPCKLLLQLHIDYADGSTDRIVSDESWKLNLDGPIRANNEYDGETYDARVEADGWSRAAFDDSSWVAARVVPPPGGRLRATPIAPMRVMEVVHPKAVTNPKPGVYVYDMGRNMAGFCRLRVKGPAGTAVKLRYAETLRPDGTIYTENLRTARVTDTYILKGEGTETYRPRFTYHGFRYVEVTGFPGRPGPGVLEGNVVYDAIRNTGSFQCSHDLINRIHENLYQGIRGNYRTIPTDCPQRDERHGWLGDRGEQTRGESYLFDVAALYSKWLVDIRDSQAANGSIPDIAPEPWPAHSDGVTWPSSYIVIPHMLHDQYGDIRVLQEHYEGMKRWADYMAGFLEKGIMPRNTYGDWCVPPESPELIHSKDPDRQTDGHLLSTAYFHHDLRLLSRSARLLGNAEDAVRFDALANAVKTAFNGRFFDSAACRYGNGSQTSYVLPLAFGMVPVEYRERVFGNLVEKIQTQSRGHIGTGVIGGQWLMRVLSDNGRADIAGGIASKETYPGWGYMVSKGATTLWELWNGDTADPAMNSGNHVMLAGDFGAWLYEYVAGIRPASPGFRQITIKPGIAAGLTWAGASYESMHGPIRSRWKLDKGTFSLDVSIPANTAATVHLPCRGVGSVLEGGKPAGSAEGVASVREEGGEVLVGVGSGDYSFTCH